MVIAAPLAGDDPGVSRHAAAVAAEIEALLARDTRLAALPSKFGFLVDGGGVLPVSAASADIRVTLDGDTCVVTADGAGVGEACEPADAAAVVAAHGVVIHRSCGGLAAPSDARPGYRIRAPGRPHPIAVGWLPYQSWSRGAFGVGLPFGVADRNHTGGLGRCVGAVRRRHAAGHAVARARNSWRHQAGRRCPKTVAALGLIATPTDIGSRMFACPGQPACASATVATRADAMQFVALGFAGTLHVSGCAKGCAHPTPADVTLVGEAGATMSSSAAVRAMPRPGAA